MFAFGGCSSLSKMLALSLVVLLSCNNIPLVHAQLRPVESATAVAVADYSFELNVTNTTFTNTTNTTNTTEVMMGKPLLTIEEYVTTVDGTCPSDEEAGDTNKAITIYPGQSVKCCVIVSNFGTADLYDVFVVNENNREVTVRELGDEDSLAVNQMAYGFYIVQFPVQGYTVGTTYRPTVTATGNNGLEGANLLQLESTDEVAVTLIQRPEPVLQIEEFVTTLDGICPGDGVEGDNTKSITVEQGTVVMACIVVSNMGDGDLYDLVVTNEEDTIVIVNELGDADSLTAGDKAYGSYLVTFDSESYSVGTYPLSVTASGNNGGDGDNFSEQVATDEVEVILVPIPTDAPTKNPTISPSGAPTSSPTSLPSSTPSETLPIIVFAEENNPPTVSSAPSEAPSAPTTGPTVSPAPSIYPTFIRYQVDTDVTTTVSKIIRAVCSNLLSDFG